MSIDSFAAGAAQRHRIQGADLSITELSEIVLGDVRVTLGEDASIRDRIRDAASLVDRAVEENAPIYGVTTGFGGMAGVSVPAEHASASQENLLNFLACGAGEQVDERHVRGAMVLRANVLAKGCSGIRPEIIERLLDFLNAGAVPVVRRLGSIGASGDLVPLSTIARAVTGVGGKAKTRLDGATLDSAEALQRLGLSPLSLRPKEGLALVNGTSFSTAIAANSLSEARELVSLAIAVHAFMLIALEAQSEPFEDFVHRCKPHPGQLQVARAIRDLLPHTPHRLNGAASNGRLQHRQSSQVQDRYSIRCLPQYVGPILEGIAKAATTIETEMNSVSDNPLIETATGRFYQSGNFLGQYVGLAMDDLRRDLALLAKHLDVQFAMLVTPEFSKGLPGSLRGNDRRPYNMGLKGLQITANSIAPMLAHLANPLVGHYPTHAEQFNQNINGLGWGSANLAWDAVGLLRHYLSAALLFAVQAVDLRRHASHGDYDGRSLLGEGLRPLYDAVHEVIESSPSSEQALVDDDDAQSLETWLEALNADLWDRGVLLRSIEPLHETLHWWRGGYRDRERSEEPV